MKNKILISTLILFLFAAFLCSYSFATNMIQSAGNAVKNAGNAIGNTAVRAKDAIANGTRDLVNGAGTVGNDVMNGVNGTATGMYTTDNTNDYTATRTATTGTGLFGMNDTMSTWLILGIVGAVIVGLIWYYSSQYEHRNYNND